MAAPLATLADLEAHLGRPVDPAVGDAALTNASGLVRAWCGWVVSRELAVTFITQGTGSPLLSLPTLHLAAVASVTVEGVDLPPDPFDPEGYDWYREGQLLRTTGWPTWPRSVKVVADHGWDPVPDAVRAVTVTVAGRQVDNPGNVRQEAVGTVIRQYHEVRITDLDLAVLAPFRLPMRP